MDNRIPLSRGLGSSAAATVGGVVAGNALGGSARPMAQLLQIATTIESHPDNAAAVLLGGFVVSAHLGDRVEAVRFDAPAGLRCVLFIPDRRLSTEDMRRVLPAEVPLRHAVENLGRVAIGVAGIASGRFELLADLTVDRLHEPYRSVAYPELPRLTVAAREAGALGAFLSGRRLHDPRVRRAGRRSRARSRPPCATRPAACGLAGRIAVVEPRNRGPGRSSRLASRASVIEACPSAGALPDARGASAHRRPATHSGPASGRVPGRTRGPHRDDRRAQVGHASSPGRRG